jgi:hypothetical protein
MLNAGRDVGQPVGDYPVPFEFTGGTWPIVRSATCPGRARDE